MSCLSPPTLNWVACAAERDFLLLTLQQPGRLHESLPAEGNQEAAATWKPPPGLQMKGLPLHVTSSSALKSCAPQQQNLLPLPLLPLPLLRPCSPPFALHGHAKACASGW